MILIITVPPNWVRTSVDENVAVGGVMRERAFQDQIIGRAVW